MAEPSWKFLQDQRWDIAADILVERAAATAAHSTVVASHRRRPVMAVSVCIVGDKQVAIVYRADEGDVLWAWR